MQTSQLVDVEQDWQSFGQGSQILGFEELITYPVLQTQFNPEKFAPDEHFRHFELSQTLQAELHAMQVDSDFLKPLLHEQMLIFNSAPDVH
jgi:hypothetical protein